MVFGVGKVSCLESCGGVLTERFHYNLPLSVLDRRLSSVPVRYGTSAMAGGPEGWYTEGSHTD